MLTWSTVKPQKSISCKVLCNLVLKSSVVHGFIPKRCHFEPKPVLGMHVKKQLKCYKLNILMRKAQKTTG